ncbi:MAG TPA: NAD+ synthase [Gemmatimonadales bacterium]|nr:NAD+ synthase [Gemmatimonadales bacterium]
MRLVVSQFRPTKGEYAQNIERIGAVLGQAELLDPRPDLVVFPETATSGYFVEGGVKEVAVTAGTLLQDLDRVYRASRHPDRPTARPPDRRPVDVAVGFYERFQNHFHNSCLYATLGGKASTVRHVHRKVFLPTYGVFDEERFVDRGQEGVRAFDTAWGRAAILICEDAWHSLAGTIAALEGAQVILVPSASPARGTGVDEGGTRLPASMVRWERVVRGIAEEHGVFVVLANLVGFEGGKGFPGASVVVDPMGEIVVRGPLFEEGLVTAELDLDQLTHARADSPLLADLQSALPILTKGLGKGERGAGSGKAKPVKFDPATNGAGSKPLPAPRSPSLSVHVFRRAAGEPDPLAIDCPLAQQWLVSFLKDEIVRRRGFKKGILGISGGVDSALTAFLAAEALGKDNVIGVRMPYRTSSPESLSHAQLVIDKLGIPSLTVDITAAVDGYVQAIGEADPDPKRAGNVMARERMIVLFDLSAKHQALPIGTGNKSERLLGYFTWHADDAPPVNPLGDVFKTQVWALARHVGVPDEILDKPATPDLIPGQQTERDYGFTYQQADPILYYLISGYGPEELVAKGFDATVVQAVEQRLESTHWKRRLPTVAVLSQTAIGEFYLRPVDY